MIRGGIVFALALLVLPLKPVAAQTVDPQSRFALLGQFSGFTSPEFNGVDRGFGGLFAWRPLGLISTEATASFFPKNLTVNHRSPFTRGLVEGMVGVTAGPVRGRVRPFGTFRTGFVKFLTAPGPLVCPAISPPILSCNLANGEAVIAADIGGGIELLSFPRALLRVEIDDRLLNYPGSIDASGDVHDMAFWENGFRFAVAAGVRF